MYLFKKIFWLEDSLVIEETHKEIYFSEIKEIKIKKKRRNGILFFKFLNQKYKFTVVLNCDRIYDFFLHQNKLNKAIEYKKEIEENKKINTKLISKK